MAEVAVSAPGKPIWVDLGSPDVEASVRFYGQLFGWEADAPVEGFGGYRVLRLKGKQVAGIAPLMNPQQPTAWTIYIGTDDAKATTDKVKKAGGNVIVEPMQVGDTGTMAVYQDPTGGAIGVWQPDTMKGSEIYSQPGAMSWSELSTRDVDKAGDFYRQVFNWDPRADEGGYTFFWLGDAMAGGVWKMDESFPANIPPYWTEYFGVANCAESCKKAEQLGARVMRPPTDIQNWGSMAILTDPQGAVFALLEDRR